MAIREVLRMGHPELMRVADPIHDPAVTTPNPQLDALVADLWETMEETGGIGLAATQIGVNARVVVFGMESSARYPEAPEIPRTVLINPIIEVIGDDMDEAWEGCLSVPGMRGLVARPGKIRYTGFDASGQPVDRVADGFHARVVQHECDHLDGILYPMRMTDMSQFGFEPELALAFSGERVCASAPES